MDFTVCQGNIPRPYGRLLIGHDRASITHAFRDVVPCIVLNLRKMLNDNEKVSSIMQHISFSFELGLK